MTEMNIDHKAHIMALLEEAERLHIDIAPDYNPGYITLAYALCSELGEDGRDVFHRFCRLCDKYDEQHAEKTYTSCLKSNRGGCGIGTVIWMSKDKGIDTDAVYRRLLEEQKMQKMQRCKDALHLSRGASSVSDTCHDTGGGDLTDDPDPATPLPTFGPLDLPYPLDLIHGRGQTPAQCDAMLLSAVTVMGAAMDWHVCTKYSNVYQYPCLQLFIVAKSASGKGAIARTRQLADIIHDRRLGQYDADRTRAVIDKQEWQKSLSTDDPKPMPKDAVRQLFLIPGNNTGTGILQNIIDSGGNGLIFEVEADTVSSAISGDYGHWSDTLRKAFDHDRLSYNRRTDREYRDLKTIRLGVVLSGTPQQVLPMIPSAENGLFSRQVFYYLPKGNAWISQFDREGTRTDDTTFFEELSRRFADSIMEAVTALGIIELRLTPEQMDIFDEQFDLRFRRSQAAFAGEMDSSVIRQAHNCLRVMSVVAVLRMLQDPYRKMLTKALKCAQNPRGEYVDLRYVGVTDGDFLTVLSMFEVLHHHTVHLLSFEQSSLCQRRTLAEPQLVLKQMGETFTSAEWGQKCAEMGVNEHTCKSWLLRLKDKGMIESLKRGEYRKTFPSGGVRSGVNDT